MVTVSELSDPYGNFMVGPRRGRNVCSACFNLVEGYERCYSCAQGPLLLSAFAPVSYSVGREQLHRALTAYKRLGGQLAHRITLELAAVLWRFLAVHEQCLASRARVRQFELVTVVPSGDRAVDPCHPMRQLVGELVGITRSRYAPLLRRSRLQASPHERYPHKFEPLRALDGEAVLLIDDTWTTGANMRMAAAALCSAGSGNVAGVVIGRYLNRDWCDNDRRLRERSRQFDWQHCALCATGPQEPYAVQA